MGAPRAIVVVTIITRSARATTRDCRRATTGRCERNSRQKRAFACALRAVVDECERTRLRDARAFACVRARARATRATSRNIPRWRGVSTVRDSSPRLHRCDRSIASHRLDRSIASHDVDVDVARGVARRRPIGVRRRRFATTTNRSDAHETCSRTSGRRTRVQTRAHHEWTTNTGVQPPVCDRPPSLADSESVTHRPIRSTASDRSSTRAISTGIASTSSREFELGASVRGRRTRRRDRDRPTTSMSLPARPSSSTTSSSRRRHSAMATSTKCASSSSSTTCARACANARERRGRRRCVRCVDDDETTTTWDMAVNTTRSPTDR